MQVRKTVPDSMDTRQYEIQNGCLCFAPRSNALFDDDDDDDDGKATLTSKFLVLLDACQGVLLYLDLHPRVVCRLTMSSGSLRCMA